MEISEGGSFLFSIGCRVPQLSLFEVSFEKLTGLLATGKIRFSGCEEDSFFRFEQCFPLFWTSAGTLKWVNRLSKSTGGRATWQEKGAWMGGRRGSKKVGIPLSQIRSHSPPSRPSRSTGPSTPGSVGTSPPCNFRCYIWLKHEILNICNNVYHQHPSPTPTV